MMQCALSFMTDTTAGVLLDEAASPDDVVRGFTWDSNKVTPGCAFLCLEGQRADGHDFAPAAIAAGARVCILSKKPSSATKALARESGCALLLVEDGPKALRDLASAYRSTLTAIVIGVTGSSGKTTTKDMVTSVMQQGFEVVATQGNNNNVLGVPLTVLSADASTEVLVVEMGMSAAGEIADLCRIAQPDLGIITNIGVSHMEFLETQENIARAKGELIEALGGEKACAILCGDDPYTALIIDECAGEGLDIITYGFGEGCAVRADEPVFDAKGNASFAFLSGLDGAASVHLNLPGRHCVLDALAAAAAGERLGLASGAVVAGLETFVPTAMRLEAVEAPEGRLVINDAYNANPDSMRAAIATIDTVRPGQRHIAVLGDMGELGEHAREFHHDVGRHVAQSTVDLLVCIGDLATEIARGAQEGGMGEDVVLCCNTCEEALEVLGPKLLAGDTVLVKASRFMGLERVVKGLVN